MRNLHDLSPRERDVMTLVADGLSDKEVGKALNIAAGTVRSLLVKAFDKLDAKNRAHAAAIYVRNIETQSAKTP